MHSDSFQNYQYDSCSSRGICSISPKAIALQAVIILFLKIFSTYLLKIGADKETKCFLLGSLSISIFNPNFNENSFINILNKFRERFPILMEDFFNKNPDKISDKEKINELFNHSSTLTKSIQLGENLIKKIQENLELEKRDLYNITLFIIKSLSINLLELESYDLFSEESFILILEALSQINIDNTESNLIKEKIFQLAEEDIKILKLIKKNQTKRYGRQVENKVSYSTIPGKSILVVGTNIRELETILEALKDEDINIYTHDEMIIAHTFPKFLEYKNLKGQYGQGLENCLLDFATFPGPIILTKNSLHNIENLYRGRLFSTDNLSFPKGVIKIKDNDFSKVIESAKNSKGFKHGKNCDSGIIGFNYESIKKEIDYKLDSKKYKKIIIIGQDEASYEKKYFEKLIKIIPNDILILSFSYNIKKENLVFINSCFDNFTWITILNRIKKYNLQTTIFAPKCGRSSLSQLLFFSKTEQAKIYISKCIPLMLSPSIINTIKKEFNILTITSPKKDLEHLILE